MWGSSSKKSSSGSSAANSNFDAAGATALFNKYVDAEEDPFIVDMDGISTLCDDLNLDPTSDIRVLVLMFKLGANAKPGEISQSEWNSGMSDLSCGSIEDVKSRLAGMDTGFMEHSEFKKFYKFVFQFSREGTHRTIEKDMVTALLQMVLGDRNNVHLNSFCEFLEQSGEEAIRITLDQWTSFLEFSVSIGEDCVGYEDDENCAWPVLLDEYVAWKQKSLKK